MFCISLAANFSHAELLVAEKNNFSFFTKEAIECTDSIELTVKTDSAASYDNMDELNKVTAGVGKQLNGFCSKLSRLNIKAYANDELVLERTASKNNRWALEEKAVVVNPFASQPSARQTIRKSAQGLDIFEQPARNASNTTTQNRVENSQDEALKMFEQNKSTPKERDIAKSSSLGEMSVYCTGTIQQYTGSMKTFSSNFEFRTLLDLSKNTHEVVSVSAGELLRAGANYSAKALGNDIIQLDAESTEPKWVITSLTLDLATSIITGSGSVDLTAARAAIDSYAGNKLGKLRERVRNGGFDSARKVEAKGSCRKL